MCSVRLGRLRLAAGRLPRLRARACGPRVHAELDGGHSAGGGVGGGGRRRAAQRAGALRALHDAGAARIPRQSRQRQRQLRPIQHRYERSSSSSTSTSTSSSTTHCSSPFFTNHNACAWTLETNTSTACNSSQHNASIDADAAFSCSVRLRSLPVLVSALLVHLFTTPK